MTNKVKLTPTDEQENIISMSKSFNEMKISAYAGAAKTSTLCMVAEHHPVKSLMLTFSKDLVTEATDRFPKHVECRTTHSLAYQHFGRELQNKLERPKGAYRNVAGTGTEIAKYFKTGDFIYMLEGERETRRIKQGGVGVAIKETVARYEQSDDLKMDWHHVSVSPCDTTMKRCKRSMQSFRYLVLDCAKKLWKLRTDVRSPVLATHDTYLKLFQLSKPDLSEYKILYLDECQDTNGATLDIFLNQKGKCKLFAVGDSFQNIYSWRGAENAMMILDWPEAKLSKSFRFGQEVGDVADAVLAQDGRIQTNVKGWEKLSTQVLPKEFLPNSFFSEQYAVLCRTNSYLIQLAVKEIQKGKKSVNLEIDVKDFVKFLNSAVALADGDMKNVKHEKLVQFENWNECTIEADVVKGELKRVVDLVNSGEVDVVLNALTTHKNVKNPDVIFTTAHKSKGREFNNVLLGSDFPSPYDKDGNWIGLIDAERNLLYVALTRVKKILGYNSSVEHMIQRVNGKVDDVFQKVVSNEVKNLDREVQKCISEG